VSQVFKITHIYSATASLKKKKSVKVLKKQSVGLVDCAKDSLTSCRELAEEADKVVGRLPIETRGRLFISRELVKFKACQSPEVHVPRPKREAAGAWLRAPHRL
jgi:hypothetical protein